VFDSLKTTSDLLCESFRLINLTTGEAKRVRCAEKPWLSWDRDDYEGYLQAHEQLLQVYDTREEACTNALNATNQQKTRCDIKKKLHDDKVEYCNLLSAGDPTNSAASNSTGSSSSSDSSSTGSSSSIDSTGSAPPPEPDICAPFHCASAACAAYKACYDVQNSEMVKLRQGVSEAETGYAVQWVTLKRIDCLIDVMGKNGSQIQTMTQQCLTDISLSAVDTSHLVAPRNGDGGFLASIPSKIDCESESTLPQGCVQLSQLSGPGVTLTDAFGGGGALR